MHIWNDIKSIEQFFYIHLLKGSIKGVVKVHSRGFMGISEILRYSNIQIYTNEDQISDI